MTQDNISPVGLEAAARALHRQQEIEYDFDRERATFERQAAEIVRAYLPHHRPDPVGQSSDSGRVKVDLALVEATVRKVNPGRSEDHIKSVALDALSVIRALSPLPSDEKLMEALRTANERFAQIDCAGFSMNVQSQAELVEHMKALASDGHKRTSEALRALSPVSPEGEKE